MKNRTYDIIALESIKSLAGERKIISLLLSTQPACKHLSSACFSCNSIPSVLEPISSLKRIKLNFCCFALQSLTSKLRLHTHEPGLLSPLLYLQARGPDDTICIMHMHRKDRIVVGFFIFCCCCCSQHVGVCVWALFLRDR